MPRKRRVWVTDGIYHVFSRGSNRAAIFLDEGDYARLHSILFDALEDEKVRAYGWAFMPNHWHGLFRAPEQGLSLLMKRVNHQYALRFNRRRKRTAHVFENRFGAVLQETDEQLKWTLRYVARNPIEAGIAGSLEAAKWTSYPSMIGIVRPPAALSVDEVLGWFDERRDVALSRYVAFVNAT